MNQKEWKTSGKFPGKYKWYNQTRKFQRSLCYESDPSANIIHHLRDTEEQRNYNDTHYEYWGFNEDGTFEYGKYVVFVTEEWHNNYHAHSEETKSKIREANEQYWTEENRMLWSVQMSGEGNGFYGKHHSDETKTLISKNRSGKYAGEDHPFYGKHHTDESRKKISDALSGDKHPRFGKYGKNNPTYGRKQSEEAKKKISEGNKGKCAGEKHPFYGKPAWNRGKNMSDESKEKMSAIAKPKFAEMSVYYKEYCKNGGTIKWQQFQKYFNEYKRLPVNHSTDDFIKWVNNYKWA